MRSWRSCTTGRARATRCGSCRTAEAGTRSRTALSLGRSGRVRIAVACSLVALLATCRERATWRDSFETSPFATDGARWCERYHHAHFVGGALEFRRSLRDAAECGAGGDGVALSCAEPGCDPCGCPPPCSPCAKAGDPNGNAIVMTTTDAVGAHRLARATFTIVRQLPVQSHVGIYVALHPHCHTTVQGLLVADGPGAFHLNVAAFNQFIGGDPELYAECIVDPFEEISPPLATAIALAEGETYAWELAAELEADGRIVVATSVHAADGALLASGAYAFHPAGAARWFGAPGAAARYAFGAEFTLAPSPSGGGPVLRLEEFEARH